ncbi:MAG: hypothetical protein Aurels2KO_05490 [Aureliella sp.]
MTPQIQNSALFSGSRPDVATRTVQGAANSGMLVRIKNGRRQHGQQGFVQQAVTLRINKMKIQVSTWLGRIGGAIQCAAAIGTLALGSSIAFSAEDEKKVTFEDHIKPIFREHCTTCHSETDKESDLALDTYSGTLAGGSSGDVIESGTPDGSRLFALVTHAEGPFMPPDEDPISQDKIALLKTWIEQGMPENSGSKIRRVSSAATAMLTSASIGRPEGPPPLPESLLKQPVLETPRSAAISAMAASPWAPLLAIGGQEQVVLYHAESRQLLGIIPFPEGEPQSLTFTRDGKQILIGGGRHSHSGCAVLVDIATGERLARVGDELDIVLAADISPDKSRIAIAGPQKFVRIFDTLTGDLVHSLKKHTDWIFALRYSPDGILLASGDRSSGLVLWEAESGLLYGELKGHKGAIRDIDFRADSNVLVSASMDGTLKTWDMFESKLVKSFNGHGGGVTSVQYTQSGDIASAGRDRRLKLFDGAGKLKKQYAGLSEAALEVAITGDGKYLAGGDWNGKVLLWAAEAEKQSHELLPNPPSIATRLTAATENAAALREQLTQAEQSHASVQANADNIQAQHDELTARSAEEATKLAQAKTAKETAAGESKKVRNEIKQLEAKLAALRSRDDELNKLITRHSSEIKQHSAGKTDAETKLAGIAAKLAAAKKQFDASNSKLAAARTAYQAAEAQFAQAQADKEALDKQAAELKSAVESSKAAIAAKAAELATKQAKLEQQEKQANMASVHAQQLAEQLDALKQQLAEAEAASSAAAKAKAELAEKALRLKEDLTTAEQAGADAAAALKMFKQTYEIK